MDYRAYKGPRQRQRDRQRKLKSIAALTILTAMAMAGSWTAPGTSSPSPSRRAGKWPPRATWPTPGIFTGSRAAPSERPRSCSTVSPSTRTTSWA